LKGKKRCEKSVERRQTCTNDCRVPQYLLFTCS
jgi:hypothetical protein